MVRHYYVNDVTEFSKNELETVIKSVESPVCLLGGWAVHLQVNEGFRREYGRDYIGSRDIDLGFHVDPSRSDVELRDMPVGGSIERIGELGYSRSRFGFVKNFHRETGERLSEDEANELPLHDTFEVFIDIIPDTSELDSFEDAFGFRPPSEPLLKKAFDGNCEPLSGYVDWRVSDSVKIAEPSLLAAMKIRSAPERDKNHKRVKDLADLHALLWYVKDFSEIQKEVTTYVTGGALDRLESCTGSKLFENAANLLQIDSELVRESILRLKT
jgi:hypothetical protein